jgi:hypothetical protein
MAEGVAGAASPTSALQMMGAGAQAPGAGADAMQAQLQQTVQQIRQIGDLVQQLAGANPALAQEAQQIGQLLKQMIIRSAQQAPQQTMSGAMTPGGGAG